MLMGPEAYTNFLISPTFILALDQDSFLLGCSFVKNIVPTFKTTKVFFSFFIKCFKTFTAAVQTYQRMSHAGNSESSLQSSTNLP